jgi:tetratricopeptide (TPR) repeat protein
LSAVFIVFWALVGIFNSRYRNSEDGETCEYSSSFINKALKVLNGLAGIKKINAHAGVIVVPVIIILFVPIFITGAKGNAREAVKLSSQDIEASISSMKKAAQSDPLMPQYKIDTTKLILSKKENTTQDIEEIKKLLDSAEKLSWNNSTLIAKVGSQYVSINEIDRGLSLFDRSTELRPLWPIEWQQEVGAYYSIVQYYLNEGKKDKAAQYIDRLKDIKARAEKVNKKNLNPFIFDQITDEKLERLQYAKEKMQLIGKEGLEKLVFYGIMDMDINFDGVPDQWTPYGNVNFKVNNQSGAITVESKDQPGSSYLETRALSLAEKKKYRIEFELLNKPSGDTIPFAITGLSQQNESLKFNGTGYSAEISVPEGFKPSENMLRIFVLGKYEIKSAKILEI